LKIDITALENAVVTVVTEKNVVYNAKFDANGVATSLDDKAAFTVTANSCTGFTLSTVVAERGLNITSLTISTQVPTIGAVAAAISRSICCRVS
jgi:hypothetical protein